MLGGVALPVGPLKCHRKANLPILECEDFLWVVTPPYHFQNVRYLDTSYGIPRSGCSALLAKGIQFCAELPRL